MSIIRLNVMDTCTLLTATTLVEDTVDVVDEKTTTVTSLSATMSTAFSNEECVYAEKSMKYVDSLSDTQIVQMINQLEQKEREFDKDLVEIRFTEDFPKMKVKTKE